MAQPSLFGMSPQDAQQALQQQDQAQAHAFANQMGPQGNPYYSPAIGSLFGQAGNAAGRGLQTAFGVVPPEIQKAYTMQEVMQEVDSQGVEFDKDPVGYMKLAASSMLKRGLRDEAMQAIQQAQAYRATETDMGYKDAMGNQANAVATEKQVTLDEKEALMQAQADLATAKASKTKVDSEIAQLEEARASARDPKEMELLDAKIYNLRKVADAMGIKADKAGKVISSNVTVQKVIGGIVAKQAAGLEITPEEQDALDKWSPAVMNPLQAVMGSLLLNQQGGVPPVVNPRAPASAPKPKEAPSVSPGTTVQVAPAKDIKQLEGLAKKAGWELDFTNYEYGIDKKTGGLLRKRK